MKLAKHGGLYNRISQLELADEKFRVSWQNVLNWKENTRYLKHGSISQSTCEKFIKDVKQISQWINIQNY